MRPSVFLAALAAAAILAPLAALSLRFSAAVLPPAGGEVVIGIDHQHVATLTVTATRSNGKLLFAADNTGTSGLGLLVPADWKRSEVRNVPIDSMTMEPPVLGMRRVSIASGAGVSFTGAFPATLKLHAAGAAALKVTMIAVDLDNGTSSRDVRLVQQSTVVLWGE